MVQLVNVVVHLFDVSRLAFVHFVHFLSNLHCHCWGQHLVLGRIGDGVRFHVAADSVVVQDYYCFLIVGSVCVVLSIVCFQSSYH